VGISESLSFIDHDKGPASRMGILQDGPSSRSTLLTSKATRLLTRWWGISDSLSLIDHDHVIGGERSRPGVGHFAPTIPYPRIGWWSVRYAGRRSAIC
jgi:hypothetical protein